MSEQPQYPQQTKKPSKTTAKNPRFVAVRIELFISMFISIFISMFISMFQHVSARVDLKGDPSGAEYLRQEAPEGDQIETDSDGAKDQDNLW